MAAKSLFVVLASACLVKMISGQCIGAMNSIAGTALAAEELALAGSALAYNGLGYGAGLGYGTNPLAGAYGYPAIAPTSGGGFAVTSSSPIAPTGITVVSENAIEGSLAVNGQLPFLGAIALEGALPTAGAGAINYGCGNGAVGIVSEGIAPAVGPAYPGAAYGPNFAPGLAPGLGYPGLAAGLGYNGRPALGLGCGAVY